MHETDKFIYKNVGICKKDISNCSYMQRLIRKPRRLLHRSQHRIYDYFLVFTEESPFRAGHVCDGISECAVVCSSYVQTADPSAD